MTATLGRKRRQWSECGFAEGKEVLVKCRNAWEQGSEIPDE